MDPIIRGLTCFIIRFLRGTLSDCHLRYPTAWFETLAARLRGDVAVLAAFGVARGEVEKKVAAASREVRNLLLLAMIDAGWGRKEEAVQAAQLACTMPTSAKRESVVPAVPSQLAACLRG